MDWGAQGREAFVIESGATNRTARSRSSSWLWPTRPPTAGSCLINSASPMQNASCMLLTSSASSTTSMLSLTAQMPFAAQRTHAWWHIRNQPHPPLHSGIRVICGPHWVGKLPVRPANKLLLEGDIQTHTMERRSCDQSGRLLRGCQICVQRDLRRAIAINKIYLILLFSELAELAKSLLWGLLFSHSPPIHMR